MQAEQQHKDDRRSEDQGARVLICGAGFAGLASAWWMNRLGFRVTVVEIAPEVRRGGTPVDIRDGVIPVVKRMGLLEQIVAKSLPPRPTEFLDPAGVPLVQQASSFSPEEGGEPGTEEWEIERDVLLDMLFARVKDDVEFVFGESLAGVQENADGVEVTLASGAKRQCSLLLGCDGTHSAVRRMCFGDESRFVLSLENYFSLTIVDKLLLEENTAQMFSVPGKTVMLNAYNGKTDIAFCFHSEDRLAYDRRNREQQKQMILDHFEGGAWRIGELLQEMRNSENFYFDQLCQVRMGAWTQGRVVLVGDAGYCPSPAAGMGGSMALLGAAALADAFALHPGDHVAALRSYGETLRPAVDDIQGNAISFGMKMFMPETEEAIQERNAVLGLSPAPSPA